MLRVAVIISIAVCFAAGLDEEWKAFKAKYNKVYGFEEFDSYRKNVFYENVQYIANHNAEADKGMHTYWLGVNEYADMPIEEFVAIMNGYLHEPTAPQTNDLYRANVTDVPSSVDWRTKGYVTAVKNQAQCGSCWAFSTTGSLEGQHFKATQNLVSLSEQNLMDCSKKEGNHGCEGGLMDQAFKYIKKNHGIDTEASYPYTAKDGHCHFSKANVGATLTSWKDIHRGDESALEQASAEIGPISVGIDAGHRSFQLYKRGVYVEPQCSSKSLDHGVLVVGYGVESGQNYWLVKNSWGTSWGMDGYIMMAKNKNNMCGIATQASYPIV